MAANNDPIIRDGRVVQKCRYGSISKIGCRPHMEDYFSIVPKVFQTAHFFAVFDGHDGSEVAKYCSERMHIALIEAIQQYANEGEINGLSQDHWKTILTNCFANVDAEVVAPCNVGSTAVVANCGDSRAVLSRGKEPIALSVDHKPNREDELARIEAAGGSVIQWNGHGVFGVLAMSRSIGDRNLKPWVICEPEVTYLPRVKDDDECLILASDGLWDVISNEEACDLARKHINAWYKKNGSKLPLPLERREEVDPAAQAAAEFLSRKALQRGSKDNVTVVIVDMKAR